MYLYLFACYSSCVLYVSPAYSVVPNKCPGLFLMYVLFSFVVIYISNKVINYNVFRFNNDGKMLYLIPLLTLLSNNFAVEQKATQWLLFSYNPD